MMGMELFAVEKLITGCSVVCWGQGPECTKLSEQLGGSLTTERCSRTLWLAGGTQRTAGRGSLHAKMGTRGGRAVTQTTCSEILGGGGGSELKRLEAYTAWDWLK